MTERISRKTVTQKVTDDEIANDPFLRRILDRAEGKTVNPINEVTGEVVESDENKKLESSVTLLHSETELETQKEPEKELLKKTMPKADCNYVTVKTEKTFMEYCREIYQWSVRLSNEQEADLKFIVAKPEWMGLFSRLRLAQGNLIKVVGPQGSGKTTLSNWLRAGLPKSETYKTRMAKGQESFGYYEKIKLYENVEDVLTEKTKRVLTTEKDWSWNIKDDIKHLIVDLWDYSKNSRRDITKALDAIQDYWDHRCDEHKRYGTPLLNIVVFLQKEALPLHFFLGKMEYFEIKPWKPNELAECYQRIFTSYDPFTKEALTEIAYLSRGIFRNFKRYISNCLSELFNKQLSIITKENVKTIITTQRIVQDMELQLSELFPHSKKNREYAVTLLRFLREHGETQQTVLTKQFFTDKMSCSRLLNALALHGYVEFIEEGRERIWKVKGVV